MLSGIGERFWRRVINASRLVPPSGIKLLSFSKREDTYSSKVKILKLVKNMRLH